MLLRAAAQKPEKATGGGKRYHVKPYLARQYNLCGTKECELSRAIGQSWSIREPERSSRTPPHGIFNKAAVS